MVYCEPMPVKKLADHVATYVDLHTLLVVRVRHPTCFYLRQL
jgi:hypothetical protein